ncbi:hypothetical protein SAMN06272741_2906 [Streptomyces sp. 2114.4]|nr:hypothetical protein SAMN06272741_2906 [Streptomyces sp. 2114.4]
MPGIATLLKLPRPGCRQLACLATQTRKGWRMTLRETDPQKVNDERQQTPTVKTLPDIGQIVHDTATGKVGEFRGFLGGRWMLRPPGGGVEWEANPEAVESAGTSEHVRALAAEHNARCRTFRT